LKGIFQVKSIKWLQISDLHFGNPSNSFEDMREQLLEYIKRGEIDTVEYLFITGDIIYAGKGAVGTPIERYKSAIDYIDKLQRVLWKNMINTELKNKVFIVPGNHDLLRENDNFSRTVVMKELRNLIENNQSSKPKHINNTFEAMKNSGFIDFYNYYADEELLKNLKDDVHYCIELDDVVILHINSSFSSCENNEEGSLVIDSSLLRKALLKYDKDSPKPIIALAHHSFGYFSKREQENVEITLKKHGVSLYLCGHEHSRKSEKISKAEQVTPLSCFCCGTLVPTENMTVDTIIFWGEMNCTKKEGRILSYKGTQEGWSTDTSFGIAQGYVNGNHRFFNYTSDSSTSMQSPQAIVVTSESFARNEYFTQVNKKATKSLSIYGVRLTNVTKQFSFKKMVESGGVVRLCMINPEIVKEMAMSTPIAEPVCGLCSMGADNYCVFCQLINSSTKTIDYYRDLLNSYNRIINTLTECEKYRENIEVRTLNTFLPLSINIINENENNAEAIIEQYIPFSTEMERLLTKHEKMKDGVSFDAILNLFNNIWGNSEIIEEGEM
jgi:3',5'-cyclic AMP phosphodiesterase CpdA